MASHGRTNFKHPSPRVSHVLESDAIESVSSPKPQDNDFSQPFYSPPATPFHTSFSPSEQAVDFGVGYLDIAPLVGNAEQVMPAQDQSRMSLTMEPMNPVFFDNPAVFNIVSEPPLEEAHEQRMKLAKPQSTEDRLLQHLPLIRHEYLTQGQLCYQLKKWGISKNIGQKTWQHIGRKIEKRKREGKESEVIHCGKRMKPSTTNKAINRHRETNIFTQISQRHSSLPSPTNPYLNVCTPQPLAMEFNWPNSLPWFKFRETYETLTLNFQRSDNSHLSSTDHLQGVHMATFDLITEYQFKRVHSVNVQPCISRLAANIGRAMPEWYPGEHLQTTQAIVQRPARESIHHYLKFIIYQISNNLPQFTDKKSWSKFRDLLIGIGILRIDLGGPYQQDATIKAFVEGLFRNEMIWGRFGDEGHDLNFVTWLLKSGQDPNTAVMLGVEDDVEQATPLQAAASGGFEKLVDLLLTFHADMSPSRQYPVSVVTLLMRAIRPDALKLRIIKRLFQHDDSINREGILHAAIELRDMDFVHEILRLDIDVTKTFERKSLPFYEENALSVALATGKDFTDVILQHVLPHDLFKLVTVDVFIAVAVEGDDDAISRLHNIRPVGSGRNQCGITPLEAAVYAGRLSTCKVLLALYNGLSPTLLFLAALGGHEDVLQLLIREGADVNGIVDPAVCGEFREGNGPPLKKDVFKTGSSPTIVYMMQRVPAEDLGVSSLNCFSVLIEKGAKMTSGAVSWSAEGCAVRPLLAALGAGGSPDEKNPSGKSALQSALHETPDWSKASSAQRRFKTVQALLKNGAKLLGGEVASAIRLQDESLIELLLSSGAGLKDTSNEGVSRLEIAIAFGSQEMVRQMREACSGQYDPGSLCAAVQARDLPLVDSLLSNRPRKANCHLLEGTAVGVAARSGDSDLLRKLLHHLQLDGEPILALLPRVQRDCERQVGKRLFWRQSFRRRPYTCTKHSPLALAALGTDTTGFRELLGAGCRADLLTWIFIAQTENFLCLEMLSEYQQRLDNLPGSGKPLFPAIRRKNKQLVQALLKAGANVNDYGTRSWSPLQMSVMAGNLELVSCLLERGAKVNAPPSFDRGATALQVAAMKGYLGLARHLLDCGARVNARGADWHGRTALEGAAERGRLDMLELLIRDALTTGNGRRQFIRAVKFATEGGYYAAADLLRRSREWTEEDEHLFVSEDLIDREGNYRELGCCDEIHGSGTECIRDSRESKDSCSESEDKCSESEDSYFESEDSCSESEDSCSESEDSCSESEDSCSESGDAYSDSSEV
ncbi:uncharacterized protein NECHADRAFT_82615 [Fusarium vanettenii 77-13-4]|uniref:Clr5 domain-containing protein n=1 Tax=Fusarium vanettenii (strain ATCC MYA-4622 / CBS 123669 / FGSC 9596 / NRRL 45880 / 77-13-4) TaxID=660122 RepID=C7YXQ8_FUSV7|nr:uncharacterized protein NECHADRAFT_82615 [Fusarium vanettenii 77-13-4]EEU43627.1 hypothetical protein NECHADRAFT_82615 [Fusarium vanettenii 77-13-4]